MRLWYRNDLCDSKPDKIISRLFCFKCKLQRSHKKTDAVNDLRDRETVCAKLVSWCYQRAFERHAGQIQALKLFPLGQLMQVAQNQITYTLHLPVAGGISFVEPDLSAYSRMGQRQLPLTSHYLFGFFFFLWCLQLWSKIAFLPTRLFMRNKCKYEYTRVWRTKKEFPQLKWCTTECRWKIPFTEAADLRMRSGYADVGD